MTGLSVDTQEQGRNPASRFGGPLDITRVHIVQPEITAMRYEFAAFRASARRSGAGVESLKS